MKFNRDVTGWILGLFTFCLLTSSVLSVCPSGCVCDDESLEVDCLDAHLDFVPITLNPLLRKLLLSRNRIRSVESGFGFYHELEVIDLSFNNLIGMSPGSFSSQTKLLKLQLNNNKIRTVTFGPLSTSTNGKRGGLPTLTHLNLRLNLIEKVQGGTFSGMGSLQELDLGENKLIQLEHSALFGLTNLRILKLDNNQITSIPTVFSGINHHDNQDGRVEENEPILIHLVELFLGNNALQIVPQNAFGSLSNLAILDLSGCELRVIHQEAFAGLSKLQKLILMNNNLKSVPTSAWPPLRGLEMLLIGQNPITTFPPSAFSQLRRLKVMEMSGAPELVTVDPMTFDFNYELESVQISHSPLLVYLPPKLFGGKNKLRTLILKDNALHTLPEDLVNWQSLTTLVLEGNPLDCSCDLIWLRDLLLTSSFANSSSFVLCGGPPEVAGKRLDLVFDDELNCNLERAWGQTLLGISLSLVIFLLFIFFFLLHKFHHQIKDAWRENCFRRRGRESGIPKVTRRGNSSSCGTSSKGTTDCDLSIKSPFLSHHSAYPYGQEEFDVRKNRMTPGDQGHYSHPLNPNNLEPEYYRGNSGTDFHPPRCVHGYQEGSWIFRGLPNESDYERPLYLAPHYAGHLNPVMGEGKQMSHYHQPPYLAQLMRPIPTTEL